MRPSVSLLISFTLLLVGCSSGIDVGVNRPGEEFTRVEVCFATDRDDTGAANPYDRFGAKHAGSVSYGTCEVSVPKDHRMGEVEASFLGREWLESPESHVVLRKVTTQDARKFFQNADRSSAFVFVHGFNVKFADAAKRTAQMTYDLGFRGTPIFFSWPSHGELSAGAYHADEREAAAAVRDLKVFLNDYLTNTRTKHLYLIAHSMGGRPMTGAVAELLREHPEFRPRIRELILAAPDIDAKVFKTEIAPALTSEGAGQKLSVTLYASKHDRALRFVTEHVDDLPRIGDASEDIPVLPGIQTIDASEVDTSFSGHCYYAECRSVISDIFYLLRQNPEDRFGLRREKGRDGEYWSFKR